MQTHFTLTSSAGRFVFPKPTNLSHAKLVRDTVTGASRGAIPHVSRPTRAGAVRWVRENLAGPAEKTNFEWIPE